MALSGVKVSAESLQASVDLQQNQTKKYVIFSIQDKDSVIGVADSKDGEKVKSSMLPEFYAKQVDIYKEFVEKLKQAGEAKECRYALFDFIFEGKNQEHKTFKTAVVFFSWSPDDAAIKQKMLYASSKDGLKKKITGIKLEIQASDFEELDIRNIEEKCRASDRG